jgi:hypothetical protein
MSTTITTGKKAAAFKREDGTVIYVLFEKTHSTNCHPATPHWGCIAIGEYVDVMFRVFGHASSCEGGSLQGDGKRCIKPENYIAAWRREIAAPVGIHDVQITLEVGDSYRAAIGRGKLEEVRDALINIGRTDVFDAIQTGKKIISLYQDTDIVLALYGVNKIYAPWKILDHLDTSNSLDTSLGPVMAFEHMDTPPATVYRIDRENVLVQLGSNGQWQQWGWQYAAVDRYVREVAYACEMKQTGSSKRLIAEFRELCTNAPAVPNNTKLKFSRNVDNLNKWNLSIYGRLVHALTGNTAQEDAALVCEIPALDSVESTFAEVKANEDALYCLNHLANNQVEWIVQSAEINKNTTVQQLDLLAA